MCNLWQISLERMQKETFIESRDVFRAINTLNLTFYFSDSPQLLVFLLFLLVVGGLRTLSAWLLLINRNSWCGWLNIWAELIPARSPCPSIRSWWLRSSGLGQLRLLLMMRMACCHLNRFPPQTTQAMV